MMPATFTLRAVLLLPILALLAYVVIPAPAVEREKTPRDGPGGTPEPQSCQAGCAAVRHPKDPISHDEIRRLLGTLAREMPGTPSSALETLLFHGPEVISYLEEHGHAPLHAPSVAFLQNELRRDQAAISLRVVDTDGRRRIELEEIVPIGEKQHLHAHSAAGIAPPEVSFTVERVGLHHLWTRI